MKIFVLGISHKTAPIDLREKLAINDRNYDSFSQVVGNHGMIYELTPLSTCHRTEFYGVTRDEEYAKKKVLEGLSAMADLSPDQFEDKCYFKTQNDAVHHLFRVTSGLDSMVIGENEILGQVKNAYNRAFNDHITGKVLNVLFQKSFSIGKKVRTHTHINQGKLSVASIAVDLSRKIFFKLHEKTIVSIGAGDVATQLCKAFKNKSVSNIFITSRTPERAESLATTIQAKSFGYHSLDSQILEADILVTSVAVDKPVITKDRVQQWARQRKGRALFMIDLGVPRNVEEEAGKLPDVYLYNIDDLKFISEQVLMERKSAILDSEKMISDATVSFMNRLRKEFSGFFQS